MTRRLGMGKPIRFGRTKPTDMVALAFSRGNGVTARSTRTIVLDAFPNGIGAPKGGNCDNNAADEPNDCNHNNLHWFVFWYLNKRERYSLIIDTPKIVFKG